MNLKQKKDIESVINSYENGNKLDQTIALRDMYKNTHKTLKKDIKSRIPATINLSAIEFDKSLEQKLNEIIQVESLCNNFINTFEKYKTVYSSPDMTYEKVILTKGKNKK